MNREERKLRTQFLIMCRRYKSALIESSLSGDVSIPDIDTMQPERQELTTNENLFNHHQTTINYAKTN